MKLEVITGNITTLAVDAIVNAANENLLGGGGVDGAIHGAAGRGLLEECREIRRTKYIGGLPVGEAVITGRYALPAKAVIHTVGPVYDEVDNPAELLANAYKNSLRVAEENAVRSIAFPAISTGVFRFPKKEAAVVVRDVMRTFQFRNVQRVVLCYYSDEDRMLAERIILGKK